MAPTRTFVAIGVPDHVRDAIRDIVRLARRSGPPGLRWSDPDRAHATLAFLGDQDAAALARVRACVRRVAGMHAPFRADLRGAGAFPRGDAARVVWLGWGEGAAPVVALHAGLRSALSEAGIVLEARRFHPHVTLARARAPRDVRALVDAWASWRSEPWTVTTIDLMASRLAPSGAEHVRLERVVLADGG
jgi:RNA 2',3'-cyclic 3'-phosphodiesterase